MQENRFGGSVVFYAQTGSSAYANAFEEEWRTIASEKSAAWAGLELGVLYVTLTYTDGKRPSRIYKTSDGLDVKVYVDRQETRIASVARAKSDAREAWALVESKYRPRSSN